MSKIAEVRHYLFADLLACHAFMNNVHYLDLEKSIKGKSNICFKISSIYTVDKACSLLIGIGNKLVQN